MKNLPWLLTLQFVFFWLIFFRLLEDNIGSISKLSNETKYRTRIFTFLNTPLCLPSERGSG